MVQYGDSILFQREFDMGVEARNNGRTLDDNPFHGAGPKGGWNAGWYDADLKVIQEREDKETKRGTNT